MKAYKGFNKDMTCRGFKFEEGKTYEESEAILCKRGFHACTNPIDVFTYYPPATSVYHEVELDDVSKGEEEDTKICGRKIKIGKQLNFNDMIHKGFEISMQLHGENIDNSHAVTVAFQGVRYKQAPYSNIAMPSRRFNIATPPLRAFLATPSHQAIIAPLPRRAIIAPLPRRAILATPPHRAFLALLPRRAILATPSHQAIIAPPPRRAIIAPLPRRANAAPRPHQAFLALLPHQAFLALLPRQAILATPSRRANAAPRPHQVIIPLQRLLAEIQKQNLPLETGLFLRNTANGMVKHIQCCV